MIPQIHKFGGASLADGPAIARAVAIVQAQRPARLVVVVSALAGVTDALLDIAAHAVRGEEDSVRAAAATLHARHAAAARALLSGAQRSKEALRLIDEAFAELEQIASGLVIVRELTPRTSDYLVARGERLSAQLVAAGLEEAACPVALVDALEVIKSDGTFGHASPNLALTDQIGRASCRERV